MRIKVIGENDCARALRGLLRKAGFAVSEYLPAEVVAGAPSGGYVITIEEKKYDEGVGQEQIHFDSVDCELEGHILRHVTALSKQPVVVDRPGGVVHSDREIRILVPAHLPGQQMAVEFGVLRGLIDTINAPVRPSELLDTVHGVPQPAGKPPIPWWRRIFPWKADARW
jgi:hypothetical protein